MKLGDQTPKAVVGDDLANQIYAQCGSLCNVSMKDTRLGK